jgi:hypothetical protein
VEYAWSLPNLTPPKSGNCQHVLWLSAITSHGECLSRGIRSFFSVERVRHFVSINMLVFSAVSSWLCRAVWLCLIVCMCLAALYSVDVPLSGICRGICRASKRHSVERHVSRVSTHFRDQSRPIASNSAAYCAC